MQDPITVTATIARDIETVWTLWTGPEHIVAWNHASDDWECPKAENNVRVGGSFSATMSAKDGSASFEFGGVYTAVDRASLLEYMLGDGRQVSVRFEPIQGGTKVTEMFEAEKPHSRERQRSGWQSILDTFKRYAEERGR